MYFPVNEIRCVFVFAQSLDSFHCHHRPVYSFFEEETTCCFCYAGFERHMVDRTITVLIVIIPPVETRFIHVCFAIERRTMIRVAAEFNIDGIQLILLQTKRAADGTPFGTNLAIEAKVYASSGWDTTRREVGRNHNLHFRWCRGGGLETGLHNPSVNG